MSVVAGLAACVASSFAFGSMYVSVRISGDPGDGIVVQWIVCSAIFLSGLVTYIATGAPPFQPFAMIGGFLWAIGNLTAIPIINTIGLGMGILIWGAVNCIVGWATGRFGLFGVKSSMPVSPNMNYLGLVLVIVGEILFAFVRPKTVPTKRDEKQPASSIRVGREEIEAAEGTAEESQILMDVQHQCMHLLYKPHHANTQGQQQHGTIHQKHKYRWALAILIICFSFHLPQCTCAHSPNWLFGSTNDTSSLLRQRPFDQFETYIYQLDNIERQLVNFERKFNAFVADFERKFNESEMQLHEKFEQKFNVSEAKAKILFKRLKTRFSQLDWAEKKADFCFASLAYIIGIVAAIVGSLLYYNDRLYTKMKNRSQKIKRTQQNMTNLVESTFRRMRVVPIERHRRASHQ